MYIPKINEVACSPQADANVRAAPEGLLLAAAQFSLLVVDAVLGRELGRLRPNSPSDDNMNDESKVRYSVQENL